MENAPAPPCVDETRVAALKKQLDATTEPLTLMVVNKQTLTNVLKMAILQGNLHGVQNHSAVQNQNSESETLSKCIAAVSEVLDKSKNGTTLMQYLAQSNADLCAIVTVTKK